MWYSTLTARLLLTGEMSLLSHRVATVVITAIYVLLQNYSSFHIILL